MSYGMVQILEHKMISLNWMKCGSAPDLVWCSLERLDLSSITASGGVYVIWHEGTPGRYVRVGQGDIRDGLSEHRNDPRITAYAKHGKLRVTWAAVPEPQRNGVERYLADQLNPLVGDVFPHAVPIAVNLPQAA